MEMAKVKELLLQSLEHEMGGVKVYETALKCVLNEDLKEEWEKYHQETEHHVQVLRDVFAQMQLDPEEQIAGPQDRPRHGRSRSSRRWKPRSPPATRKPRSASPANAWCSPRPPTTATGS